MVFTPQQLRGLHFHLQGLAAERADLRERLEQLRRDCNEKRPRTNVVAFPRYRRQRPG